MPNSTETVHIENEHLRHLACFRDGRRDDLFPGLGDFGSLPNGKSHVAGVLMTHIVHEALGLRRWPGHADRLLSVTNEEAVRKVARWFATETQAPTIIQDCVDELHRVRAQHLEVYHRRKQSHRTLYRNVGWLHGSDPVQLVYAHLIYAVVMAAEATGQPAAIELDTVTHWTPNRTAYSHGSYNIKFREEISVEDILLDGGLVRDLEGPEVLVVNRSPHGRMSFSPDQVTFRDFQPDERIIMEISDLRFSDARLPLFIPAMERLDQWLTIHDNRVDATKLEDAELWQELGRRLRARIWR